MTVFDRPIRVAIVERCEIVRRGLAEIVQSAPDIDLVATANDVGDATTLADRSPAVILIAVELLVGGGRQRLAELVPSARLVQLAWPAGPRDGNAVPSPLILSRTADAESVLRTVRQVVRPEVVRPITATRPRRDEPVLTPRQQAVLRLIGQGLTNREIADHLGLTEKTVKNHVTAILAELGVARRTHAMAYLQAARAPWLVSA
jgi:DNA-binding NarL/FixJ family response regulator